MKVEITPIAVFVDKVKVASKLKKERKLLTHILIQIIPKFCCLFYFATEQAFIMSGDYSVVTQSMVNVKVSSNATSFLSERKIPKEMKIIELKVRSSLSSKLAKRPGPMN